MPNLHKHTLPLIYDTPLCHPTFSIHNEYTRAPLVNVARRTWIATVTMFKYGNLDADMISRNIVSLCLDPNLTDADVISDLQRIRAICYSHQDIDQLEQVLDLLRQP